MATKVNDLSAVEAREAMLRVLERQKAAHLKDSPVPAAIRKDRLRRAIDLLVDHEKRLVDAMAADFGHRPTPMSRLTDIAGSIGPLKQALKHLDRWMRPDKRRPNFPFNLLGAKAWVEYQPLGVVGIISPWNFPVQLTFGPLAGVFAAGNRAMIKPSEYTPITSELMKELFASVYDETEVATFTGGPEVGQAFSGLPFDHLLFTGATSVGRHVMRAAADNLVPVTLELGGKSPVIVSRSADIARTAERVVVGKMLNAGQICLAPDYMLVPEEKADALTDALAQSAAKFYPTLVGNPDYTSVVNPRHRERIESYVTDATAKGARAITVNPAGEDFSQQQGTNKLPLTILRDVHDQMKVMQDEIFGPVLPVMTYRQVDEAIDYVNAHPRPLGLYYFGTDAAEQRRVLDRTTSGGVTVNDVVFHVSQEDLPFGGVGPAGMGAYHGFDGFKTFSHAKAVFRQTGVDVAKLGGVKPPYGPALDKTLAREIRK
ncbi:coniferyl aldehyde dehydrogenase [Parapedomonas caeni]